MRTMLDDVDVNRMQASYDLYAGYVKGSGSWDDYNAMCAKFPNAVHVAISTRYNVDAQVIDVENGAAWPPENAPAWAVRQYERTGVNPSLYCNTSTWPRVQAAFAANKVQLPIWWAAKWPYNGLYPGSTATQTGTAPGGSDFSVVADYWPGIDPVPTPPPTPPAPPTLYPIEEDINMIRQFIVTSEDQKTQSIWVLFPGTGIYMPVSGIAGEADNRAAFLTAQGPDSLGHDAALNGPISWTQHIALYNAAPNRGSLPAQS